MTKRYADCQFEEGGDCAACSLSNYNKDCRNNPVNILAYYRSMVSLSQVQLATKAGVNKSLVEKIEGNKINPENITLKNAVALAKALGITAEELLNATEK